MHSLMRTLLFGLFIALILSVAGWASATSTVTPSTIQDARPAPYVADYGGAQLTVTEDTLAWELKSQVLTTSDGGELDSPQAQYANFLIGCYAEQAGWQQRPGNTGVLFDCTLNIIQDGIITPPGPNPTQDDALDGFIFQFPPGWTITSIPTAPVSNQVFCTPPWPVVAVLNPYGIQEAAYFGYQNAGGWWPGESGFAPTGCGAFQDVNIQDEITFQLTADIPASYATPPEYPDTCPGSPVIALDDAWLNSNYTTNAIWTAWDLGTGGVFSFYTDPGYIAGIGFFDGFYSSGADDIVLMRYNTSCPQPVIEVHKGILNGVNGSCIGPEVSPYDYAADPTYEHGDYLLNDIYSGDTIDYCYVIENMSREFNTDIITFFDINGNSNFDGCDVNAGEDFCLNDYHIPKPRPVAVNNHNVVDTLLGDIDGNAINDIVSVDTITWDPADVDSPNTSPRFRVEQLPPTALQLADACVDGIVVNDVEYEAYTLAGYGRLQGSSTTIYGTYRYSATDGSFGGVTGPYIDNPAANANIYAEDEAVVYVSGFDVDINKSGPITATQGDTIMYTLTVDNNQGWGEETTTDDTLPAGLSFAGQCQATYIDMDNPLTFTATCVGGSDSDADGDRETNEGDGGINCTFDTSASAGEIVGVVDFQFTYNSYGAYDPAIRNQDINWSSFAQGNLTSDAGTASFYNPLTCSQAGGSVTGGHAGDCTHLYTENSEFIGEVVGTSWTFTLANVAYNGPDPEHELDTSSLSLTIYPYTTASVTLPDTQYVSEYTNNGIVYQCPVSIDLATPPAICRDIDQVVTNQASTDASSFLPDADLACDPSDTTTFDTTVTIPGDVLSFSVSKIETSTGSQPGGEYVAGTDPITFDITVTNTGDVPLGIGDIDFSDVTDNPCMSCALANTSNQTVIPPSESETVMVSCTSTSACVGGTVCNTGTATYSGSTSGWTDSSCVETLDSAPACVTFIDMTAIDLATVQSEPVPSNESGLLLIISGTLLMVTFVIFRRNRSL